MSENTTSQQPTLFAADSLASLTVTPGSAEARQMTVTSGLNILGLLERHNRDLSLERTFLASSLPCSTRLFLTWRVSSTPAGRLLFQLAPSMPFTGEIGSLSWPTPTVADTFTGNLKSSQQKPGSMHSVNLSQAVRMWPTPSANEDAAGTINGKMQFMLTHAAKLSDPEGTAAGGQLNPEWVEWLMGFPTGWTDLGRSETP